jgi:hypothetical protein
MVGDHDTGVHALRHDSQCLQRKGAPMNFTFDPLDHPDTEVTRAYFCALTARSSISAYRLERSDPQWPKPELRGKRDLSKADGFNRVQIAHPDKKEFPQLRWSPL